MSVPTVRLKFKIPTILQPPRLELNIPMKHSLIAINRDLQTTRPIQTEISRTEESPAATVGPRDAVGERVLHVVFGAHVELGGEEEEDVFAVHEGEGGGFDVGTVRGDVGEDLGGFAEEGVAVPADLLEHDWGRDDGADGVAASAAVADGVAVDFVDDVAFVAVALVGETRDVDGASCGCGADPGLAAIVDEGFVDDFACGVGEGVEMGFGSPGDGVVHDEGSVVQPDNIRSPDSRYWVRPSREDWQSIDPLSGVEGLPVAGKASLNVDQPAANLCVS